MTTSATLLAEHIARKLAELEDVLADRGEAVHAATIERAQSVSDRVLADFLKRESSPADIRRRIASIRDWLQCGDLERAYRENETLQLRLEMISRIVRGPAILTGAKQRHYLAERRNAANEQRSAQAAERHFAWQQAADDVWSRNPRFSNRAVARRIATQFPGTNPDTIRRSIRKLAEPR